MADDYRRSWRYQPVYHMDGRHRRTFSVCEVFLDDEGGLDQWTQRHGTDPEGNTQVELIRTLRRMTNDAKRWKPVNYDNMRIGMTFERAA